MTEVEQLNAWGQRGRLRYTLSLPAQTPSNNEIKGMHFHVYKAERRKWRTLIQAALKGNQFQAPIRKAALVISRQCAGGLDWDNAYGGLKPMLDCLVAPSDRNPDGQGLIQDDNPVAMPFPPYVRQLKGKRGDGTTEVLIYELDDDVCHSELTEAAWGAAGRLVHVLDLPTETLSNNVVKNMHFHAYKKVRNKWREMVQAALKGAPMEAPVQKAGLVVVRNCVGYLDWDNAYGGLKPMLDCLVAPSTRNPDGLGIIQDDNPQNMPHPPYIRQVKAKRGAGSTQVLVYDLP